MLYTGLISGEAQGYTIILKIIYRKFGNNFAESEEAFTLLHKFTWLKPKIISYLSESTGFQSYYDFTNAT